MYKLLIWILLSLLISAVLIPIAMVLGPSAAKFASILVFRVILSLALLMSCLWFYFRAEQKTRKTVNYILAALVIIIVPIFIFTYTKAVYARNKAVQKTRQRFSELEEEIYKNVGDDDSVGMDILLTPINDRGPVDDQLGLLVYYTVEFDEDNYKVKANVRAVGIYNDNDCFSSDGNIDIDLEEQTSSQCIAKKGKYVWEGGSSPGSGTGDSNDEGSTLKANVSLQTDGQGTDTLTVIVEVQVAYLPYDTESFSAGMEKASLNENKDTVSSEVLSKSIRHEFKFKTPG
ncbi:MAG: hypothetical protein K9M75_04095 [Phycisphaerae bacterium]|nr:hypothetical protein [Phycisphaerae bacterium]